MAIAYTPSQWGGASTSFDYDLRIQGKRLTDQFIDLLNHSLTGVTPENIDAVTQNVHKKVNGRKIIVRQTLRPQQQIGINGTINVGNAPWSPVLDHARLRPNCHDVLAMVRLCPENSLHRLAYVWENLLYGSPSRPNDPVTVNEATLAEWQVEFQAEREFIQWGLGLYQNNDVDALYAISFGSVDCLECTEETLYSLGFATGGIGGVADDLYLIRTEDRFANFTVVATPAPVSSIGRDLWSAGQRVLVGFADEIDIATATVGGTLFSADALGSAPTIDSNITAPIHAVGRFNNVYLAAGGVGSGNGLLYTSNNGIAWDAVNLGVLADTKPLASIGVDDENSEFYVGGQAGLFLRCTLSAGAVVANAVTLPSVGTEDILTIAVLGPGHIMVGGTTGYAAESFDRGVTWEVVDVPGTGTVTRISGTSLRTWVATGNVVYERSVLTNMEWEVVELMNGATTGTAVTALHHPPQDIDGNFFLAATAGGKIFAGSGHYPNA